MIIKTIKFTDNTDNVTETQYSRYKDIVTLSKTWLSNQNGLTILHLNISSLRKHFNELLVLLFQSVCEIDILILTEINIKEEEICLYAIPGYDSYAYTRETCRGGGILVYHKEILSLEFLTLPTTSFEAIHAKVTIDKRVIHIIA